MHRAEIEDYKRKNRDLAAALHQAKKQVRDRDAQILEYSEMSLQDSSLLDDWNGDSAENAIKDKKESDDISDNSSDRDNLFQGDQKNENMKQNSQGSNNSDDFEDAP